MKRAVTQYLLPHLWIALAAAVYAFGFNWCYAPNGIGFGGLTGVGQVVNALAPQIPVGTVVIVLNIPLFLLGWKLLGGRMLLSSLYAMLLSSAFIDLFAAFPLLPPLEDPLLSCVFGGVLIGGSLGVVFLYGASTGGTDLIARLLKLKIAWLPMGRLLMCIDLVVIVAVAVTFRSLYSALYGVVALYLSARVMDGVLYGPDHAKVAYIISDRYQEITRAIVHILRRGVTLLKATGGWSGTEKQVLLVAFKRRQIVSIKRTVREIDPAAFLIVCEAHEVLGDGFRRHQHNDL